MKKITKTISLEQHTLAELSLEYQNLVQQAIEALEGSYAPYSKFPVGAAILTEKGTFIKGANQENAAYPSGLCAERTALFYYGANYNGEKIKALAVVVGKSMRDFPFPCGSCLQVISEYEQSQSEAFDILLIHAEKGEVLISQSIENLLPFAFKKEHLA